MFQPNLHQPSSGNKMPRHIRSKKTVSIEVSGEIFEAEVLELPFREGVELSCWVEDEEIRVSDRGLGEHEAIRLMKEEIQARLVTGS